MADGKSAAAPIPAPPPPPPPMYGPFGIELPTAPMPPPPSPPPPPAVPPLGSGETLAGRYLEELRGPGSASPQWATGAVDPWHPWLTADHQRTGRQALSMADLEATLPDPPRTTPEASQPEIPSVVEPTPTATPGSPSRRNTTADIASGSQKSDPANSPLSPDMRDAWLMSRMLSQAVRQPPPMNIPQSMPVMSEPARPLPQWQPGQGFRTAFRPPTMASMLRG